MIGQNGEVKPSEQKIPKYKRIYARDIVDVDVDEDAEVEEHSNDKLPQTTGTVKKMTPAASTPIPAKIVNSKNNNLGIKR